MAGHDVPGRKVFDHLERSQPGLGVADGNDTEHALDIHDVAGEQHLSGGQPDHHVARGVATPAMAQRQRRAAQFERDIVTLDQPGRQRGHRAVGALSQGRIQCGHVLSTARLHVRPGLCMGDQLGSLRGKVAIAQPAVVLPAGVDDPTHRLRRDLFNRSMNLLCRLKRGTAVNQHRACGRDDQSDVGVERLVVIAARAGFANEGIHPFSHLAEADLDCPGTQAHRCKQAQEQRHQRTRNAQGKPSLKQSHANLSVKTQ